MASTNSTMAVAGAAIKALRMRRKWSGEELGRRVGLTRKGISKIERGGSTTTARLEAIATALDVTVSDLLPVASGARRATSNVPKS